MEQKRKGTVFTAPQHTSLTIFKDQKEQCQSAHANPFQEIEFHDFRLGAQF
jgi:hypothetical protein